MIKKISLGLVHSDWLIECINFLRLIVQVHRFTCFGWPNCTSLGIGLVGRFHLFTRFGWLKARSLALNGQMRTWAREMYLSNSLGVVVNNW